MSVGITGRTQNHHYRGNKSKTGTQVRRYLAFSKKDIQQSAYTVHKQAGGGVDVEQKRHEHRSAEHGKQMLQAERRLSSSGGRSSTWITLRSMMMTSFLSLNAYIIVKSFCRIGKSRDDFVTEK